MRQRYELTIRNKDDELVGSVELNNFGDMSEIEFDSWIKMLRLVQRQIDKGLAEGSL